MSDAAFHSASSRLTVDLDAIARNWLLLKKKLKNGADCAGVVKADAYGLGAEAVSRALYLQGCRHFFVAQYAEGLKVRAALATVARSFPHSPVSDAPVTVDAPVIYVLEGPCGAQVHEFIQSGLVPVLNSPADIAVWRAAAQEAGRKLPAVLHIDTGMNRLGLSGTEVAALAKDADVWAALDIRYAMSHLACADEPAHPKNAEQLALFRQLTGALGRPLRLSFANSSGIFLGDDYHFDLARPGCAIYGINPLGCGAANPARSGVQDPERSGVQNPARSGVQNPARYGVQNPMQNPVRFEGRILQTREIDRAGSLGYGAGYAVTHGQKYVTVSIGYADGYLRSLTGRGKVYIGGVSCPVAGRVSMDSLIVATDHLAAQPVAGDWVEVIGPHQSVDDVAAQAGTIGYEIFTGLGKRTPRLYTGSAA